MIKDYFVLALKNLRQRGIRSWLTMLGIFVGIAAVVSLISLGQGLQNTVDEQFKILGTDKITIMGKAGIITSPVASELSSKPLTEKDIKLIEGINGVEKVTSFLMKSLEIKYKRENKNILISGIEIELYLEFFEGSYAIEQGRNFKTEDSRKLVIGYNVANKDFDNKIQAGKKLEIEGRDFEVVGIMEKIGSPPDDSSIIMDLESLRELSNEPEIVSMIIVKVKDNHDVNKVAEDIKTKMKRDRNEARDKEPETFVVQTSEQLLEAFGNILIVVQEVLIGIAAISLLVGGIGIMNTMYTSVLERTKEIGIMKAIGAKNSDIMLIFLFESGLLGLAGGAIGIAIGYGMGKSAEYLATQALGAGLLRASFPIELILGALAFSFLVGTISGLLPAIRASKLKPTDALRYE